MELYIHFGIYKTGSSYLQFLCAKHKKELRENRVHFPSSAFDEDMLKGKISPGNALNLSKAIIEKDSTKQLQILDKWYIEATENKCDKVVLSCEDLVHPFSKLDCLSLFEKSIAKSKFEKVHALGYFRDLVGHALSTYKHRGKTGKIKDFQNWIDNIYETPNVIESLSETVGKVNFEWSFRKFKKSSDFMANSFFKEWLGINLEFSDKQKQVNVSVSLSEILLLIKLKDNYTDVIDVFTNRFLQLPKSDKSKDLILEEKYRKVISNSLSTRNDIIRKLNAFLKEDEALIEYDYKKLESEELNFEIQFTTKQFECFQESINYLNSFPGLLFRLRRKVRKYLPSSIMNRSRYNNHQSI